MTQSFLHIREISKSFGGVRALNNVSLDVGRGEIHGLCGENGAGKSTLIKVLGGSVRPDKGAVTLDGVPLPLGNVRDSEEAGVAVIHQECVAFPHLSSFDNIFVGREPRRMGGWLLDRNRMRQQSEELLRRLGESFDPRLPVGELPLAQRQMVAIARALSQECRLLIMDEPTASLSTRETQALFRIIRQLRKEGVSILYVSHRLEEIFELASRVTVMRDGRVVESVSTSEVDRNGLIRSMVGRELIATQGAASLRAEDVVLDVRGLTRAGSFENVSLSVCAGEVVGMTGLVGAGRSEVARALFGIDRVDAGSIVVKGTPLRPGSVPCSMSAGVALVPEDRQQAGLIPPMSVQKNLSLAVLPSLAARGAISASKERGLAVRMMEALSIKAEHPDVTADTLSGGNQQKVVLGKWLASSPSVLVLDEPTRGVDVGAKSEVYDLIGRLASSGAAILLISSDLPEVLHMSDRIIVMRSGRIAGELSRVEATQEGILALAMPEAGL